MTVLEKLKKAARKNDSMLCVGLDTDPVKVPSHLKKGKDPVTTFNREIIKATSDLVCSYKLNMAFYEVRGAAGLKSLERTMAAIPSSIPVILDGKRGDIGNTCALYARSLFGHFKADSVTLNPYMGFDSVQPFLEYRNRLSFILCLTSNKSASDFLLEPKNNPLFMKVARTAASWNRKYGNLGLVIGGTYPREMKKIRSINPDLPFLVPGIGTQKGDIKKVISSGLDSSGGGLVINASRSIIYAQSGKRFAAAARKQARELRDRINNQ